MSLSYISYSLSYVFFSASSATGPEKEKSEILPYTGLPSLDNIPSVADLTAAMAKKKEEQKRLEAERKEAERWVRQTSLMNISSITPRNFIRVILSKIILSDNYQTLQA